MANWISRRALLRGLVGTGLAAPGAAAAEPAGAVETSRGECYALTAAARRALAPAAAIFIGDAVGTGAQSALSMRLGAATQVKLGPEARLRVDRFVANAGGVLILERGGMIYDHDPASHPSDVAVRGPFGLLAVRGTRFFAGPSNDVFGVFVERGAVTVVGRNTSVVVNSGFGTDIARPGAEPEPPHVWGAARIASAMASVNP
jgi:hypothetical protein